MQLRQGVLKTMTSCDTLMHFKLHFIVCVRVGVYLKMCVDMEVREPPAGLCPLLPLRGSHMCKVIGLDSHHLPARPSHHPNCDIFISYSNILNGDLKLTRFHCYLLMNKVRRTCANKWDR